MNTAIPHRLADLRKAMNKHGVAACLVPSADPHLSEYLPEHWQARAHFSGFTGSAGTLVVTADFAGVWTDSRYFEQAEKQLEGTGARLMRMRIPHTPEHLQWLEGALGQGDVLAVAGDSLSLAAKRQIETHLVDVGASLRTDLDLPGQAWTDRAPLPQAPVREHAAGFVSRSRSDNLSAIREAMSKAGATHHLVSSLDDVAWITNLRGADVEYNPVFLAHLLISSDRATLFAHTGAFSDELRQRLAADGIELVTYADAAAALTALPPDARLMLEPGRVVVALLGDLPASVQLVEQRNPSTPLKAIKNAHELEHVRATMRHDGAALVEAFAEIERDLIAGDTITELDVETRLRASRAKRPHFVGESFGTIAGYMANGALPHYSATPEAHSTLGRDGLLLVDSGGQYEGGTTDITRVWAFGQTTEEQRRDCTLVLKGMIALSRARFPEGASGPQLDALARAPLWAAGADFGHGTGHGVGYFMNVHEGQQGIRPPRSGGEMVALEPGMINSIEPGIYKPGRHGIRHENLAAVVDAGETEFGRFLSFETLTLCPIDTRAIEPALLEPSEREWLNGYHHCVREALLPLIEHDTDRQWLKERCQPV
ncbi:aminopeptidase P family protein [Oleiagrimonas sp. C23AA]|uniref:aminopeptidase P family protein n=1 Tax=Oleiagrimonas sp. C23AA TaxID=2719047 RepID=UPI00141DDBB3|nr:aminopeptidase P family protein [Oleiagrimonas sp. C23AA]NII09412.1 aminopeptidase P family protein [Oleiagrimonas sp. C23AA]